MRAIRPFIIRTITIENFIVGKIHSETIDAIKGTTALILVT